MSRLFTRLRKLITVFLAFTEPLDSFQLFKDAVELVKMWCERIVASSGSPNHVLQGMSAIQLMDIVKESRTSQGLDWTALDAFLMDGNSWGNMWMGTLQ